MFSCLNRRSKYRLGKPARSFASWPDVSNAAGYGRAEMHFCPPLVGYLIYTTLSFIFMLTTGQRQLHKPSLFLLVKGYTMVASQILKNSLYTILLTYSVLRISVGYEIFPVSVGHRRNHHCRLALALLSHSRELAHLPCTS